MKEIFVSILSAGFYGSVMILLVIAARLLLRKAPRSIMCLLWVMVGLRLLIPFQIESSFSLQPEIPQFVEQGTAPVVPDAQPDYVIVPDRLPPDVTVTYDNNAVTEPVIRVVDYGAVAAVVWSVVACGMVGYTLISYLFLKRKVSGAVLTEDGVYETEAVDSPFLLGYIRPSIYLPKGLPEDDRQYILAHERGHLERGDNWIKLVGFLCVSVHWFNPLVWLGYHLLCKDIEMACDEYVVKYMDLDSRKGYSAALVNCSTKHRFGACPVAFGEVSVKQRVLSVLRYRKPGFWISLVCLLVIGFVAGCFLTNPITEPEDTDPLTTVPNDHAQILEQCEGAFSQFVGGQAYEIQVTTKFESQSGIMDYSTETQFLRNGDDWFRRYTICEDTFEKTESEMAIGGTVYKRSISASDWTATNDSPSLSAPWTMEIDWENLVYQATEGALGSRGYSFLLDGEEDNIITFCFDGGGKLTSILHTFDIVTEMDTISHVTVNCKLVSNDARWITKTIEMEYQQNAGHITNDTADLQKCKEVLEIFQSQDSYYMRVHFEHNDPDILSGNSYTYYWHSGEDYLQCDWTQDWEDWCLYTQGKYYRKNVSAAMPPEELSYGNWTWVEQPEQQFSGEPWIMSVRWDEAYVTLLDADVTSMEEVITVSVDDPEAEYPYQLTFCFDRESGSINSIRLWHTYGFAGATYTSSATIESYGFDESEINATIQKYYLETQVQAILNET